MIWHVVCSGVSSEWMNLKDAREQAWCLRPGLGTDGPHALWRFCPKNKPHITTLNGLHRRLLRRDEVTGELESLV